MTQPGAQGSLSGIGAAPDSAGRPTLSHAIAECRRELALRSGAYPRLVAQGKLRQGEADEHRSRLQAAHNALVWLRDNRERITRALKLLNDTEGSHDRKA